MNAAARRQHRDNLAAMRRTALPTGIACRQGCWSPPWILRFSPRCGDRLPRGPSSQHYQHISTVQAGSDIARPGNSGFPAAGQLSATRRIEAGIPGGIGARRNSGRRRNCNDLMPDFRGLGTTGMVPRENGVPQNHPRRCKSPQLAIDYSSG